MASRKAKRRNSEKRKEKSRDAARSRRNKEADVFTELARLLPLSNEQSLQQDKASIMRLTISHLKLRMILGTGVTPNDYENSLQKKLDVQYSKALEGFAMIIAKAGDIVYLSESVNKSLGLTQLDLVGHSIYDYTHPCDHEEIREMLSEKAHSSADGSKEERCFLTRMKCTLTSKGRNINLKSATYKVMFCSGRFVTPGSGSQHFSGLQDEQLDKNLSSLLLIAEPIPHPANIEVPLDSQTFISRHSLDMKITHCDDRIGQLLGYKNADIMNHSVFEFHHALDTEVIKEACKNLFSKGQAIVSRYRFLARGGGYCWVQTEATIINNQRTDKPLYIVCVNYVLSGVEESHLVLSDCQTTDLAKVCPLACASRQSDVVNNTPSSLPKLSCGITLSTETIFAQRPSDADQDLLQITHVDGKTHILEDLQELAPSAGEIMPLTFMNEGEEQLYKDVDMVPSCYSAVSSEQPSPVNNSTQNSAGFISNTGMTVLDLSFLRNDNFGLPDGQQGGSVTANNKVRTTNLGLEFNPKTQMGEELDEVEFDLRAPYIPMDGEEDKVLDPNWIPLLDEQMENSHMLGMTEAVFAQKPPEPVQNDDKHKVPMSILRLQAANKMIDASDGDIARNAGPPKIKRPMETNRLEHGPPVSKTTRVEPLTLQSKRADSTQEGKQGVSLPKMETDLEYCLKSTSNNNDHTVTSGSSVLKNLLTIGQDVNNGYKITQANPLVQFTPGGGSKSLKALLLGEDSTSEDEYEDSDTLDGSVVMMSPSETTQKAELPPALQSLAKPLTSLQKVQNFCQKSSADQGKSTLVTVIPAGSQGATLKVLDLHHHMVV